MGLPERGRLSCAPADGWRNLRLAAARARYRRSDATQSPPKPLKPITATCRSAITSCTSITASGASLGLVRRTVDGVEREYLCVEYADEAQLFVPVHQADRLTRYVGPDNRPPALSRLGSAEWSSVKGARQRSGPGGGRRAAGAVRQAQRGAGLRL